MSRRRKRPQPPDRGSVKVIFQSPVQGLSEFNQVGVLVVEEHLGLTPSTLDQVRAICRRLPFEPSMLFVAGLVGHVEAAVGNSARQLQLAERIIAPGAILDRYRELLQGEPRLQIWGPQSLYVLMRLLIEEATDAVVSKELSGSAKVDLLSALIASNTLVESGQGLQKPPGLEDLLAFETQIGSYYSRATWLEDMTRPQALMRLAADSSFESNPSFVPVNEWLSQGGLSATEQWELGFALGASVNAWDPNISPMIDKVRLEELLGKLSLTSRSREALDLVSATRRELQASFQDFGTTPERVAWEVRPFSRTPFLRLTEGGLLLMGRPWIHNWLADGFYYRGLDVARARDQRREEGKANHVQRYTEFVGHVFEQYCLDRAKEAFPPGTPVHGEQAYSKGGGSQTSDISVLLGRDLLLFEAHGRRPAAEPLVSGDPVEIVQELRKLLLKKINQLGTVIGALKQGKAEIPGIDAAELRSISPVVINNGRLWQTPRLWQYLDAAGDPDKTRFLQDPDVRPVQTFDATDFEMLLALASNHNVAGLLKRKASGRWRARDLASWFKEDPAAPKLARLPFTETLFDEMSNRLAQKLSGATKPGKS